MFLNNILKSESSRKYFANTPLLKTTLHKYQARHKAQKALDYIHVCIEENLCPNFLRISKSSKLQIGLTAREVLKLQKRKLQDEQKYKFELLNTINSQ